MSDGFEDYPFKEQVLGAAPLAYERCVAWFGTPANADWEITFWVSNVVAYGTVPFWRQHIIALPRDCTHWEQVCSSLAHEMYHRVTSRKRSLIQSLWVDEMLAQLTELHFLKEQGFEQYANFLHETSVNSLDALPPANRRVADLRRVKRSRFRQLFFGRAYPAGFIDRVMVLGIVLEKLVGWEAMCHLANCRTWRQWFGSLPISTENGARILLEMP